MDQSLSAVAGDLWRVPSREFMGEKQKHHHTTLGEFHSLEERWYKICVVSAETGVWKHIAKLHVSACF